MKVRVAHANSCLTVDKSVWASHGGQTGGENGEKAGETWVVLGGTGRTTSKKTRWETAIWRKGADKNMATLPSYDLLRKPKRAGEVGGSR